MVDFRVDPAALQRFAQGQDVLESAAAKAVTYSGHTNVSAKAGSGSVLQRLLDGFHAVQPALEETFRSLQTLADRGGEEILRAKSYYEHTEAKAAAEYERQHMRLPRPTTKGPR